MRKWKRSTEKLTKAQILQRFHMFDINGNGILSVKEFRKALESFDIKLNDVELETLISKFDVNGDGEISIAEFKQFIDEELLLHQAPGAQESGEGISARAGTVTARSSSAGAAAAAGSSSGSAWSRDGGKERERNGGAVPPSSRDIRASSTRSGGGSLEETEDRAVGRGSLRLGTSALGSTEDIFELHPALSSRDKSNLQSTAARGGAPLVLARGRKKV